MRIAATPASSMPATAGPAICGRGAIKYCVPRISVPGISVRVPGISVPGITGIKRLFINNENDTKIFGSDFRCAVAREYADASNSATGSP